MRKTILILITFAFLLNSFGSVPSYAEDFRLPAPGVMVHLSPQMSPPILKGIKVYPDNPFKFEFIMDQGDSHENSNQLKEQSYKLIKYFLASLTTPKKDLWVNLSPYEKDRIIPQSFGLTEMGRDLLAEDYMLKQITASLIYPEDKVGKEFWKRIYEEAYKKFGTTNFPINTFNKVWIVPEKAVVYENSKTYTAFVVESKLKILLEQDYLSLEKHEGIQSKDSQGKESNQIGNHIVREIIIPELAKEVNYGKNFSQLRQVYNSLILATWYKKKIKDSILEMVYADKNKIAGIKINDPEEKERIYKRYLQAFKKGTYNFIKEEIDPITRAITPRKYFSGGEELIDIDAAMKVINKVPDSAMLGNYIEIKAYMAMINHSIFHSISPVKFYGIVTTVAAISALVAIGLYRKEKDLRNNYNNLLKAYLRKPWKKLSWKESLFIRQYGPKSIRKVLDLHAYRIAKGESFASLFRSRQSPETIKLLKGSPDYGAAKVVRVAPSSGSSVSKASKPAVELTPEQKRRKIESSLIALFIQNPVEFDSWDAMIQQFTTISQWSLSEIETALMKHTNPSEFTKYRVPFTNYENFREIFNLIRLNQILKQIDKNGINDFNERNDFLYAAINKSKDWESFHEWLVNFTGDLQIANRLDQRIAGLYVVDNDNKRYSSFQNFYRQMRFIFFARQLTDPHLLGSVEYKDLIIEEAIQYTGLSRMEITSHLNRMIELYSKPHVVPISIPTVPVSMDIEPETIDRTPLSVQVGVSEYLTNAPEATLMIYRASATKNWLPKNGELINDGFLSPEALAVLRKLKNKKYEYFDYPGIYRLPGDGKNMYVRYYPPKKGRTEGVAVIFAYASKSDLHASQDTSTLNASFRRLLDYFHTLSYENLIPDLLEPVYDEAMLVSIKGKQTSKNIERTIPTGGIDLTNNEYLQAQNSGNSIKLHLNQAQLAQLQNTLGIRPLIVNIQPLKNIGTFLNNV